MTFAAALLGAPLWLATAVAAPPSTPTQKIVVDVRGPVALVEVTRPLSPDDAAGGERILDVALPEHAALVDVALRDDARWRVVASTEIEGATHAYVDRLASRGMTPARVAFDEGTRVRVRAVGAPAASIDVRYRFTALVDVADGREHLRFPAAPERLPVPADVAVSFSPAPDAASEVEIAGARTRLGAGARATARGRATTRSAWEISWAPAAPSRGGALGGSLVTSKVDTRAGKPGTTKTLAAVVAEARQRRPPLDPPPNVLLLIDRSRSVGLPGLAAERDLARKLLEALPPATRFDALFFARDTRRLFPMSRPATPEAMGALDAKMVPDELANGTNLEGALREAGALLRRESSAFAPRTLLAIVTDGALPQTDGAALARAIGETAGIDVTIAAFVVRPKGDEPASRAAVVALRALVASRGGVVRALTADELEDGVPAALSALASGGDVADVRLVAGVDSRVLADALAPGEGIAAPLELEARGAAFALVSTSQSGQVRVPLRPQKIDATWLRALDGDGLHTGLLSTDGLVVLVEHAPEVIRASDFVHGSLDRTVVRNTLALAFMPRARACYLNRTSATPAERDLTGRVRLAIDFTRGEVGDVVVQSSTLNHAGIEACLRDGAFAIEVPRTLRSDSASTAVLNLVFRPRTPEKHDTPEEAALGAQIDLVIEELHRTAPPTDETPPPDRSMIPTR